MKTLRQQSRCTALAETGDWRLETGDGRRETDGREGPGMGASPLERNAEATEPLWRDVAGLGPHSPQRHTKIGAATTLFALHHFDGRS